VQLIPQSYTELNDAYKELTNKNLRHLSELTILVYTQLKFIKINNLLMLAGLLTAR